MQFQPNASWIEPGLERVAFFVKRQGGRPDGPPPFILSLRQAFHVCFVVPFGDGGHEAGELVALV
ncbi:MAG: hypothetical protein AAF678_10480, partial [Pseudomonadota bacterium]